jgi:tetratricopeptide (TPR) repeat protein
MEEWMETGWPDFNDLWDYNDPAASEEKLREVLAATAHPPESSYVLQLKTQLARTLGLQRKFDEAHALLDEVEAGVPPGDVASVRLLLERGRLWNSSRQPEQALPLFKQAAESAAQLGAEFYEVDALHMLGIADAERSLEWNIEAIRHAENASEPRARGWLGSLYNNTGWSLFDLGQYEQALEIFEKALAFRVEQDRPREIHIARWCVARTLRQLGRVEEALEIQRTLEASGEQDGFVDEEIAECLLLLGRESEARAYFQKAYASLAQIDWVAEDTARLERLKSLGGR